MRGEHRTWRQNANCVESPHLTFLFFSTEEREQQRAKAICRGCIAKTDCFLEAVRFRNEGICAGMTQEQRILFLSILPKKQGTLRDRLDHIFGLAQQETHNSTNNENTPTPEQLQSRPIFVFAINQTGHQGYYTLPLSRLGQTG